MTEREQAVALATEILGRPYADPDDDLALLSRQFLRALEREKPVGFEWECFNCARKCNLDTDDYCPTCGRELPDESEVSGEGL